MNRGDYRHVVSFQGPGAPVPDGDGGWLTTWANLTPATWHVSIRPATARDLERTPQGTTISTASHIVTGDYRADVTTQTRMLFDGRTFSINGVSNLEERNITMVLIAVEMVP